jgi:hypothetical protein
VVIVVDIKDTRKNPAPMTKSFVAMAALPISPVIEG